MSLTTLIKLTSSYYSRHFRGNGMKNGGPAFNYLLVPSINIAEGKSFRDIGNEIKINIFDARVWLLSWQHFLSF